MNRRAKSAVSRFLRTLKQEKREYEEFQEIEEDEEDIVNENIQDIPFPESKPSFIYESEAYITGNDPLSRIKEQFLSVTLSQTLWISVNTLYHFYYDENWRCGYRNIQILAMAAINSGRSLLQEAVFSGLGYVPDVLSIQKWIERAWNCGWDPEGREIFEGRITGQKVWIGAVEVAVLFRSFGIRTYLVDFLASKKQSQRDGFYHRGIEEFVWRYFKVSPLAAMNMPSKVRSLRNDREPLKMPLYLQYQGHSKTIVGVEKTEEGACNLILFDPTQGGDDIDIHDPYTRINVRTLNKEEYQLAFFHEVDNDHCIMRPRELERSKRIDKASRVFEVL